MLLLNNKNNAKKLKEEMVMMFNGKEIEKCFKINKKY
jgi:hypothetical protein